MVDLSDLKYDLILESMLLYCSRFVLMTSSVHFLATIYVFNLSLVRASSFFDFPSSHLCMYMQDGQSFLLLGLQEIYNITWSNILTESRNYSGFKWNMVSIQFTTCSRTLHFQVWMQPEYTIPGTRTLSEVIKSFHFHPGVKTEYCPHSIWNVN